jgi:predicted nucleotidyltransferase
VLAPRRASRVALVGRPLPAREPDIHLLVEFAPDAAVISLGDWLQIQRELRRRCGCAVELVSVNRLEERVASDTLSLTVLYDASTE